jgi:putative ABC transport system permease protein
LQHARMFALRQAARRVSRPGNQTRAILLAVGLGTFFVVGVRSLQTSLIADMELQMRTDVPDMFLIDVQSDQAGPLRTFLARELKQPEAQAVFIPVLRARVTGVKGQQLNLENAEEVRRRHSLGREYVITYRPVLERNERVVEGAFWPPTPNPEAEVSIERSLRDRAGLGLGDLVRFDVLGRGVTARVTSVRSVDWAETRAGGFMFVFRPGVLEQAPHMFVVTTRGPSDTPTRARLQRDVTARFPNVSVIDVREILTVVRRILSNVTLAVSVVGGLVLVSGILILVGSISMTKYQRVYEAAILKTLGATTRTIGLLLAFEYALLGAVAGCIGSAGALGLSWAVSRYGVKMPWMPSPLENVAAVVVAAGLVAAVGMIASLDVLRKKPLGALRAE